MSQPEDQRRSDPPTGSTAAGQGQPPSSPPSSPGSGPPPGYGAPAGYPPPPGYGQPPGHPQQPGYGPPPGYAAPPYGAPGWGPAWPRPTNTMAILALVLAFVFAPAGLVLGIVARRQIRETGEEGDGLALAGIIIGAIATAFFVLAIVLWVVAFASFATSDGFAP